MLGLPKSQLPVKVTLTHASFVPGVIHGLYLTYVYYERQKMVFRGAIDFQNPPPAFGVFSRQILRGLNRDEPRLAHGPIEVQLDALAVSYRYKLQFWIDSLTSGGRHKALKIRIQQKASRRTR